MEKSIGCGEVMGVRLNQQSTIVYGVRGVDGHTVVNATYIEYIVLVYINHIDVVTIDISLSDSIQSLRRRKPFFF